MKKDTNDKAKSDIEKRLDELQIDLNSLKLLVEENDKYVERVEELAKKNYRRGTTYRNRALALLKQARGLRDAMNFVADEMADIITNERKKR